ncbi:hypothetical protein CGSSp23BS72_05575 [Streptococcus pneumoniae SP23-BS72]|nr:hypothetical protein CGSSp19BS75_06937 [Streptococcus pneumoniae SP19-BS75]EDK75491.1 hypothetical protein CGSSp6BS73_03691 [Streptococcus pneumoniae SP6-BS73]EDK82247.1 hypothetical protein CGSSp23BS72_05575 [Streptococcus pneumoniae SP23-BS72]EFL67799.1 hypothetical protein CGSSp14BS292_05015 [Streptococcus pneumoniae SP14-BS292]EFL70450.1 hypothetical protein CGSSpBS293_11338 [Streptococcus pneumoniae SP-BS293]EFL71534.1 hypothetical protein CGSSpBS458_04668 [Streptococcus pneumoniae BS4
MVEQIPVGHNSGSFFLFLLLRLLLSPLLRNSISFLTSQGIPWKLSNNKTKPIDKSTASKSIATNPLLLHLR